jgi:hypothetical protein
MFISRSIINTRDRDYSTLVHSTYYENFLVLYEQGNSFSLNFLLIIPISIVNSKKL